MICALRLPRARTFGRFSLSFGPAKAHRTRQAIGGCSAGSCLTASPIIHASMCPSARQQALRRGAYQLLARTWDECVKALGLPDFSPSSQDLAAAFLIRRRGALPDALAGRLDVAIAKCNKEWASLPGSPYGQPTRTLAQATAVYTKAGGALAGNEPTQEKPMLPLLASLIGVATQGMAAVAAQKINEAIGRPEVGDAVAQVMIDTAKSATGQDDPLQAVAAAVKDPDTIAHMQTAAMSKLDELAPILDRIATLEAAERVADEASRSAAAMRAKLLQGDRPFIKLGGWFQASFIEFLSVLMMLISAGGALALALADKLDAQLMGAIVTLMLIAGYTGVREFWLGSSRSSQAKDAAIGELMKRGGD